MAVTVAEPTESAFSVPVNLSADKTEGLSDCHTSSEKSPIAGIKATSGTNSLPTSIISGISVKEKSITLSLDTTRIMSAE